MSLGMKRIAVGLFAFAAGAGVGGHVSSGLTPAGSLPGHTLPIGHRQGNGGDLWPVREAMSSLDSDSVPLAALRLHLHPSAMATGTRNSTPGTQRLEDALAGGSVYRHSFVYVPLQCVGTRRVPLVVFLHGAGMDGWSMIKWENIRALADSNGFILLAPSSTLDTWELSKDDGRRIDAALRYVLRHYAIDPTRIAMAGASDGGRWALWVGLVNGDIFNRVLGFSASVVGAASDDFLVLSRHGHPSIFVQHGSIDQDFDAHKVVQWLRQTGYTVTYATDSGAHAMTEERASAGFHWLAASWTAGH